MKTDVVCPHCGKRLAKTGFAGELVYTLSGDILLWCKECRAEIPFRYVKLVPQKPSNTDTQSL